MTLSDRLTMIDNLTTLWLVGELSAEEAYEYIQTVIDGDVQILNMVISD